MAVTVANFRIYARISPDEETVIPTLCLDAAKQHAHDAGIPDRLDTENDSKYALYIYALALHYYDNRGFAPSSQAFAVDEYTQRMMAKFRIELEAKGYDDV